MTQPSPTTDPQVAAAEHHLARVTTNLEEAVAAEYAALTAYKTARRRDPAAQTTDDTRAAWVQACRAWLDALAAFEQARDEVAALSVLTPEEHAALTGDRPKDEECAKQAGLGFRPATTWRGEAQ